MRPKRPLVDEVGRLQPEARREDAIARCRRASALDVPEHGHARLESRSLLDLPSERVADAPEDDVPELVGRASVLGDESLLARRRT